MGTRSLTFLYACNSDSEPFVCMYRQFDGYPNGHGRELAEFLMPIEVVNGYTPDRRARTHANGMGCLAAQMIHHFKGEEIGGIYLLVPNLESDSGQEYEYHVWKDKVKVIDCYSEGDEPLFTGTWREFGVFTGAVSLPTKSLRDLLSEGVVRVTFTKADGSLRIMRCTTNFDLIPEDQRPVSTTKKEKPSDPKLFKVFDCEENGWRSFREERVINFAVSENFSELPS